MMKVVSPRRPFLAIAAGVLLGCSSSPTLAYTSADILALFQWCESALPAYCPIGSGRQAAGSPARPLVNSRVRTTRVNGQDYFYALYPAVNPTRAVGFDTSGSGQADFYTVQTVSGQLRYAYGGSAPLGAGWEQGVWSLYRQTVPGNLSSANILYNMVYSLRQYYLDQLATICPARLSTLTNSGVNANIGSPLRAGRIARGEWHFSAGALTPAACTAVSGFSFTPDGRISPDLEITDETMFPPAYLAAWSAIHDAYQALTGYGWDTSPATRCVAAAHARFGARSDEQIAFLPYLQNGAVKWQCYYFDQAVLNY